MAEQSFDRDQILDGAAAYLIEALAAQGIEAVPVLTEYGKALRVGDGGIVSMENLVDQMIDLPVGQWEDHLQRWSQFAVDTVESTDPSQLDREAIASMIRTRVIARDAAEKQDYARTVAEDLVQVLCLDYPNRVLMLSDSSLAQLQMPIDQLYSLGQANTDAELIDERFEEEGIQFATGDSMFIASKIGNMPALLALLGIEAPDGLLFGVPNRSLFVYKVPSEFADIIDIATTMGAFAPESGFNNPGGLISSGVYYWAPDGTIESMMGDYDESLRGIADDDVLAADWPRESTSILRPSEQFARRFLKD